MTIAKSCTLVSNMGYKCGKHGPLSLLPMFTIRMTLGQIQLGVTSSKQIE